jgi:hypothetical protein
LLGEWLDRIAAEDGAESDAGTAEGAGSDAGTAEPGAGSARRQEHPGHRRAAGVTAIRGRATGEPRA